jgi:hypothetical protein
MAGDEADSPLDEPIVVDDGREHWVVYPDDNNYRILASVKKDKDGIRHVKPELIEQVRGWWYHRGIDSAEKAIEGLAIPWEELEVGGEDVEEGNLVELSKRLALISHQLVRANNLVGQVALKHHAAKEALNHAAHLILSREKIEEKRAAIAVRMAAAISRQKPLRNAQIEVIEAGAMLKALERTVDALDILWKTVSRIMSARLREPLD